METVLYIICGLYLGESLFFALGIRRANSKAHNEDDGHPRVSVIVAARNEERNISACLEALVAQTYPEGKFEIIAVNDESEDATYTLMDQASRQSDGRIRVITTTSDPSGVIGKAKAIAQGVDVATGEIILLTDADCTPPPTWVASTVSRFTHSVDVVAGFTIVKATSLFTELQQLDWLHLQAIAAASMAFGSPVGVVGNNMGFRRDAYEQVGGYRNVRFSMTEDFALFLEFHRRRCGIRYVCDFESRIITAPCPDLQAVLRQKHRWSRGGMESTLHGYSILVVAFFMLCAFCIAPFISLLVWAVVWGSKFVADLLFLLPVLRKLRTLRSLRSFLPFQFYFIAQALVVPLMLLNPNVRWKGRVFATNEKSVGI